ncbi:CENP-B homolog protein 2-like [Rhizophagus irregularis DAOM 181602=DAOM 197198]|nr:CENP-B homolog protein 2-like [Rhizophagus irregularis DAOM 181602=DAOM 197198]
MNETGLFYRLEPDQTLATKRFSRRKVNKECLSIALYANADGSHKLKPLIIGNFKKPCCFKNINIQNMPMTYHNNTKAWMITTLFQEWIKEFDCQVDLKHQGQHVLFLLDNCSSHKISGLTLRYTDIYFLLPNTTSKIQPMDAGIIISFKQYYHHFYMRWMLRYVEAGGHTEDLRMDVLQTIRYIIQVWDEVNAEIICNCWCHTKILPDANVDLRNISEDIRQCEDLVLNDLADALQGLNLPYPMQAEKFLNISEENVIYKVPKDDQIIEELVYLFKNANKEDIELEEMDDSNKSSIISVNIAINSLETVCIFLLQQDNAEEYIKLVEKIEKIFKVKKQT